MAVDISGYTQGVSPSSGRADMAWPAGARKGHLAVVVAQDGKGKNTNRPANSDDWDYHGAGMWSKRITADDLLSTLSVRGRTIMLATFSGAVKGGKFTSQGGVKIDPGDGGALVFGRRKNSRGALTANQTKLGDDVVTRQKSGKVRHNLWFLKSSKIKYVRVTGDPDDQWYNTLEIVPQTAPYQPTIQRPKDEKDVPFDEDLVLRWRHNSANGGEQDSCAVRFREQGTSSWTYIDADGNTSGTYAEVVQSNQYLRLLAGALDLDSDYEWQVQTGEDDNMSSWSDSATFSAINRPTVTSISVAIPLNDLSPEVTWSATPHTGETLRAWRVRMYVRSTGVELWDSGVVPGNGTYVEIPSRPTWVNGTLEYVATVQVQQSGGLWSDETYDDVNFVIAWTKPTAPSILVESQVDGPPRVTVSGIVAGALTLEVCAGNTTVFSKDSPSTTEVLELPNSPYGVELSYGARVSIALDGTWVWSDWAYQAFTNLDDSCYLVSTDGTEYLRTELISDGDRVRPQGVSTWYGLDSTTPLTDIGPVQGETGSTSLLGGTANTAPVESIVDWITTRSSWVLRWPPERFYVDRNHRPQLVDMASTTMAQGSQVTVSRPAQGVMTAREVKFSWVAADE